MSKNKQVIICKVQIQDFKQKILDICYRRNDPLSEIFSTRIVNSDLVAAKPPYHKLCVSKFKMLRKPKTAGRPKSTGMNLAFEQLCAFMEESEDFQFTLNELHRKMQEFAQLNSDLESTVTRNNESSDREVYGVYYLKDLIKNRYLSRVIFTSTGNNEILVSLQDSMPGTLSDCYNNRNESDAEKNLRIVKAAAAIIRKEIPSQI